MSEVEETEDDHKRKVQLLAAIRNKRGKEALSLIKEGVDIDCQDETGSYPLHHAATAGLDDVIEVLLEKNAKLESADKDGLTALHKAVMCGHVRSIVTLVAWGANVHTPDKRDCFALEYAIQNKDVKIVDLLCQFGTEPLLKDWEWLTTPGVRKRKEDYDMGVTIEKQCIVFPGYKHKEITFDVKRITPEDGPLVHLENTRVDVTVPNGSGTLLPVPV
ncbi:cyclin-dependent kinase 4 inhibitor D-like isoform X2 [Pecten maximus]|uniref:cyclin-dependent kinase 4 inhibitor D-like isoform X2 n=1 Tax=Pecten maximus TaxID=6579 RepID=UPI001458F32C|nr:cyclin-dependent kinase 4 inhibitor D-like isoform X2 [Pecten maximus]